MIEGKFNILTDQAWGSSAKGAVSVRLCDIYKTPNASACNFPNAGHTAIVNGTKFVGKILPTPTILKKTKGQKIQGWVGPNSGWESGQLCKELNETGLELGVDLFIHQRAVVVEDRHIQMERNGGNSTLHISSTMSGSGAAFADKAMRTPGVITGELINMPTEHPWEFYRNVRKELNSGQTFLHEVSQGWALSVNYGTHYPHCTFRDCTPQQACADFGITPDLVGDVYLNVRTFPIRVGNNYDSNGTQVGYSGDCLSDQHEMTWEQIGQEAEMPQSEIAQLAEKERTTVTKKIRRVFTQSWEMMQHSAEFCGATKLVLNFPQYLHWSAYKVRGGHKEFAMLHPKVRAYVDKMQEVTNLPVVMIGTGADHDDMIWLG